MSKPESLAMADATRSVAARIEIASFAADIVELAALRDRARDLQEIAIRRGVQLPSLGQSSGTRDQFTLCVRPDRWLLVTPSSAATAFSEPAASWQIACQGVAAVVDLSSALNVFRLAGSATYEVLARGCRLDLRPEVFPDGAAAATIMAQVSVTLVRQASSVLLLTPSTTARHLREWLIATARPFGLPQSDIPPEVMGRESLP